jgi:hypothetical protein
LGKLEAVLRNLRVVASVERDRFLRDSAVQAPAER